MRFEVRRVVFVLTRAATYSALFLGVLLVFLPGRILSAAASVDRRRSASWSWLG